MSDDGGLGLLLLGPAGAVGLYFAAGRQAAQVAVVVAMVVAVNALAVSMVLHLRRGGTRR